MIQFIPANKSLYQPCNSVSDTVTMGRYIVTICRYTLFIGEYFHSLHRLPWSSRFFVAPARTEVCANATKTGDTRNPVSKLDGFSLHSWQI